MNKRRTGRELARDAVDYTTARAIASFSSLCHWAPDAIGRKVFGELPNIVRWRIAKTQADQIHGWKTIPGNEASRRLPRNYVGSAVLHTDARALEAAGRTQGAVPAAAFCIGKYVLVAALQQRTDFCPVPPAPYDTALAERVKEFVGSNLVDQTAVIMGVGRGALTATICAYNQAENRVHSAPGPVEGAAFLITPAAVLAPMLSSVPVV